MKLLVNSVVLSTALASSTLFGADLLQEALAKLPGGQITLDVVAGLGAKSSDQMRLIQNKLLLKDVSLMQVEVN